MLLHPCELTETVFYSCPLVLTVYDIRIAETTPWQARLKANPSAVVYPVGNEQLAASIACGRAAGVKVNPYGGKFAENLLENSPRNTSN